MGMELMRFEPTGNFEAALICLFSARALAQEIRLGGRLGLLLPSRLPADTTVAARLVSHHRRRRSN